ncbi:MAG: O-antigen ligase family protein [Proteobacteria bacterium]|nr:O-antigen ligase family protein [Pseudomonadota bacterium]
MALPLVLAVLLVVLFPERRRYWRALLGQVRTPIGIMVLVTLALWLPSMVVTPLPLRSMEAWVRVPVFIGFIFFLAAMFSERQEALALALKALIVTGAIATVFALCSLTFVPEVLSFVRRSGWTDTPYPGYRPYDMLKPYAALTVLMAPVLVWGGWRLGGRWPALSVATAVGLLAVVWLTYNRSAMAALLMMLVVGAVLFMAIRRNVRVNVAIPLVLVALITAILMWQQDRRAHLTPPEGVVTVLPTWVIDWQRQTIWARTIDMAMNSPWVGNGINVINLLPGAEDPLPTSRLNIIPSHPHNWLVEVFAETGAFGAFALLTLAIMLCLKFAGDYLRNRDPAILAALMVNIGYWGSGLLNFSFWSSWWQIGYLLMTAFCLAGRARLDQD